MNNQIEINNPYNLYQLNYLMDQIEEYINKVCQKFTLSKYWQCKRDRKNKMKWTIPFMAMEDFTMIFHFNLKYDLPCLNNTPKVKYTISVIFCDTNFQPFHIESPNMINLMSRYFLKVNSKFKYGYFCISPKNGIMQFKVNPLITPNWKQILQDHNFKTLFKTQLTILIQAIQYHGYTILILCDQISKKKGEIYASKSNIKNNLKDLEFGTKQLEKIKSLLKSCEGPNISPDLESEAKVRSLTSPKRIMVVINKENDDAKDDLRELDSGGFSTVYKFHMKYSILKQKNLGSLIPRIGEILEGEFVKKQLNNKQDNKSTEDVRRKERDRIENENQVLITIEEDMCDNIAEYYRIENRKNEVVMEYYPHKSLRDFVKNHGYLGLITKLTFLLQIINGIHFLTGKKIYHLDLKFANALLSKNFICKLIDFGETYIDRKTPGNFKPGLTLPYTAPETLQDQIDFNDKMDVFAIGAMISDIAFNQKFIDMKNSNLECIKSKFTKKIYKTRINDKSIKYYGPNHLMKLLRLIFLFCTESDYKLRPSTKYLIVLFKNLIFYLEKTY